MLHLEGGTGQTYDGGYTDFVRQRAEHRLSQQRAFDKQSKVIAAEEDFIRRNIAGQDTRQAKGRRRRLTRLPRLSPPPEDQGSMAIRFDIRARGGDQALVADHVRVTVEDRVLLEDFSSVIRRGDVAGLVGPNGAGKSTLLATLLGQRPPAHGSARIGDSVQVAFYRQDLAQVPHDKTLFDIINDMASAAIAGIDPESDAQLVFAGRDGIWNRIGVSRNRAGEREPGEFRFPKRRIGRRVRPHEAEGRRPESSEREQQRTQDQAEPETSHMEL